MVKLAIPEFGREYPEYEYRPWPKYVGLDAEGDVLTALNDEEFRRLKELAVFPKVLGKDKNGNDVVAQNPRDEEWYASRVVNLRSGMQAMSSSPLTEDTEAKRGPGRPPKAA